MSTVILKSCLHITVRMKGLLEIKQFSNLQKAFY